MALLYMKETLGKIQLPSILLSHIGNKSFCLFFWQKVIDLLELTMRSI